MDNKQITKEVDNANTTDANKNKMNSMLGSVSVEAMQNVWSKNKVPLKRPSMRPSGILSIRPSKYPNKILSRIPSDVPSALLSSLPRNLPTSAPTFVPSADLTTVPLTNPPQCQACVQQINRTAP